MHSNLKGYNLDLVSEVLSKYNLDLTVLVENLIIDKFIEISNKLCEVM